MKFLPGDIVLSFIKRVAYVYAGKLLSIYDVIATEQETAVYREHFAEKKQITFAELKTVLPEFNAKAKSNRTYGTIEMDETLYLFLRAIKAQEPYRSKSYSFVDIIHILVRKQLDNKIMKLDEYRRQKNAATVGQIKQLLADLEKNM